jgi:NAD(P)-dependent dehydrogenase (short-subunit alcohol dehydrogenase family)
MSEAGPEIMVVGAAGGIGRALAEYLASRGYWVTAADNDSTRLGKLADSCQPRLEILEMDITRREQVAGAASRYRESGRRLGGLVITAAVHSSHPAVFLEDEIIDRVLDVNLASHIKLIRDFLPVLEERGSLVGVSSIAACVGVPMSSMYSASKWGLEGFYESLYNELRHRGTRVSVVHPGNVNTGFNETGNTYVPGNGDPFTDRLYRGVVGRIDSRYGISPERVARVIAGVLRRRRPRFCYVVGGNARKANWAKKILGRDMALRLMGRFFGVR